MEDIQSVIEFAVYAHKGQKRKHSGLPYIVHPMAVLSQLSDWDITCYNCWKAALCHDILEDCPHVTFEELQSVIGVKSANIVKELTFTIDLKSGKPEAYQKSEYMKSFETKSVYALVVKVADRVCNTRDFMATLLDYAPKYWRKAQDLFDANLTRKEEIMKEFGRNSFPMMKYTQTCMSQQMLVG
jgi:(p)ppGpp synthase/HD superfamily hydrolase